MVSGTSKGACVSGRVAFVLLSVLSLSPSLTEAQPGSPSTSSAVKNKTSLRSPSGRLQVVAVRSTGPIQIDGALDEQVWRIAPPAGGFVQSEPREGEPASEDTEVRLAYDADNLYIAAYCHDREYTKILLNGIREDFQVGDQDSFEVIMDTFADRRNGFVFMTNPAGARSDQQVANEGREVNTSWDAVWFVSARVVEDGWIAEIAIPFNSLRFDMSEAPVWGINFSRRIRRKNEIDFWAPVPRAYTLTRVSLAGDLVGLPSAQPGHDLRVKPYAAARTVRGTGRESFDENVDVGLDLKYGITQALTLDATIHPDFAQVEADEQQVNLTQFSQFFPEKREFFLENSGIFYVGDTARNNRVSLSPTPDTDLLLFFSRRIGLNDDGTPIPIVAGARLTGNLAGLAVGVLNVQTDGMEQTPANNYSVVRVRKNVLATSDVGAIFMTRQSTENSGDYNRVYGLDANIRFFGNLDWSTYWIKTATPGFTTGQYAFRSTINREGNFLHVKTGVMFIGDHFKDDLGFYRRIGVRKYLLDFGVRPRPKVLQRHGIREMHPHVVWNFFTDHSGEMVAKRLHTGYTFFFNNGGFSEISVNPEFQLLTEPFSVHRGSPPIPAGGYSWVPYQLRFNTDPSRSLSASFTGIVGGLWTGTQRTIRASVTLRPSYKFELTLGVQRTNAKLREPPIDFLTSIWTLRTNYSFATNMFLDSLIQYDRDQGLLNANIRFNIMHRPLSDLFIVYNEQRFVTPENPIPAGRGLIVKFTHMMTF